MGFNSGFKGLRNLGDNITSGSTIFMLDEAETVGSMDRSWAHGRNEEH